MRFDLGYGTRSFIGGENRDAAFRQTPTEHQQYIDEFTQQHENELIQPGMTPLQIALAKAEARYLGEQDEQTKIPEYWMDTTPRRDVGATSTWINNIEVMPDGGMAQMQTNDGNIYYYPLSDEEVGNWVTDPMGVGEYYNTMIRGR